MLDALGAIIILFIYLALIVVYFYVLYLITKNAVRKGVDESRNLSGQNLYAVVRAAVIDGMNAVAKANASAQAVANSQADAGDDQNV